MSKLADFYKGLKPGAKQKIVLALFIGTGAAIATGTHLLSTVGTKPASKEPVQAAVKQITMESKILEKTVTAQSTKQTEDINNLKKQVTELAAAQGKQTPEAVAAAAKASGAPAPPPPSALPPVPAPSTKMPLPATTAENKYPPPPPPLPQKTGGVQGGGESIFGEIDILTNTGAKTEEKKDKKKVETHLYLPTGSFMEATLLSGLYAPTTSGARGNPVPVLMRIKALSQLPNAVKANLKGCFVIAEGVGNLADERAHLRLVNLSCISKDGEALIDQKIAGYVSDSDGFIGLKGRVVSRLGSAIARSFVAGLVGGFGSAMQAANQTNNLTSALGTVAVTQAPNYAQLGMQGVGQGLADASKQIQTFYMDLAKQMIPVVEILPGKKITMIINEGVKLNVKPIKTASD